MQNELQSAPLLSERFEVSFNQIHEALKKMVQVNNDKFTFLLNIAAKKYEIIKTYKNDLEQYAKLRNAIVHGKVEAGYYIAEPNPKVVDRIEKIASIITKPNYALTIATKEVIFYDANESIINVLDGIRKYGYPHYPIYQNKKAIGLLRNGDILKWMATNGVTNFSDMKDVKISDVLQIGVQMPMLFVPKDMNIFEVEDLFETAHKNKRHLDVVIITENGEPNEKPLGLITAWDLIEIDYTLD